MNAPSPATLDGTTKTSASESFKSAMRHLAGGVAVITSGRGSACNGLTATSVSSLSIEPAALVVSINRNASLMPVLRETKAFGVNILAARHRGLADRFAGRGGHKGVERFDGSDWIELVTGAPLLTDALAAVDCTVDTIVDWNTHAVVIGLVEAVRLGGDAPALIYWRGDYVDL
jgi:flavin reductase (DIM6/NTAB) family NADH-FMN oxidoreductase RutF